jgi:hypothetical protein
MALEWLTDLLTEAWGEPRVQPPAEEAARHAYRSEADGLIWVKLHDRSRRAWVWFPDGANNSLALEKGAFYVVRLCGPSRTAELRTHDLTWAGLTRETLEPVARWVYGLPALERSHG